MALAATWVSGARLAENDVKRRYPVERYDALRINIGWGFSNLK
jgi:hypothetical protein